MKKIEVTSKLFAIALGLLYLFFFQEKEWITYVFFTIVMATVGISHGAIDHLLVNPNIRGKELLLFIGKYLGIMGAYLLVWLLFPLIGLLSFIVMSAYHFGQSHYLNQLQDKKFKISYFLTGLFFLLLILWADFEQTSAIVATVLTIDGYQDYLLFSVILSGLLSIISGLFNFGRHFLKSLPEILVLALLLSQLPLLMGFAIYFGFWHSLPSMLVEYNVLKKHWPSNRIKKFLFQLLPFTLLAFVGMGIMIFILANRVSSDSLIFIFFVMISLVSAPHIWYMDRFLMGNPQN
ncbi:MAG: Brp/Blh family beta-carotene 15,15'-dioxygenase [Mongoliitalea sp.]